MKIKTVWPVREAGFKRCFHRMVLVVVVAVMVVAAAVGVVIMVVLVVVVAVLCSRLLKDPIIDRTHLHPSFSEQLHIMKKWFVIVNTD